MGERLVGKKSECLLQNGDHIPDATGVPFKNERLRLAEELCGAGV